MKNTITILLLCALHFSFAQSSTKKADKLFDRMWYKEAAALYEAEIKSLDTNSKSFDSEERAEHVRLLKRAGDSYFFNTDMENAHRFYDQLVSSFYSDIDPEYIFRYAHSLEGIGKYREAKRWMKEFASRTKTKDDRSEHLNQVGLTIENVLDIEPRFILKNVSVNTKYSDFGAMYYKDKLVYSSAIDSSNYHTRIYHWNEQPFLDMYLGELDEIESDVSLIDEFSKAINTRYHEATLAFSPDETKVYFTRNNYDGDLQRDGNGTNHLKLYSAELIRDEDSLPTWQNIKELPFNSEDYSVGHPTISSDGKSLYFVSDMPGSIGATDIFVVDILESNNAQDSTFTGYSKPRNLGEKVNTAGREMFPFITDNALYFASDGHLGLGGLDVFESKVEASNFSTPNNLGTPLNSELDDFGFIVNEEKNKGFVCSNRLTGKGDDDIYSFIRLPEPEAAPCNQLVRGYVSNTITGERISNVKMALYKDGSEIETTMTGVNGAYKFNTVLGCGENYNVTATKVGYAAKEKTVITHEEEGETVVALGIETLNELIVEESGVLKIKIGIIYFDLDKSYIRKNDAALELNKIVLLMTEYPKMVIQIESHTDSRSSDDYNLELSDRRAKATRDYLISQGIAANRIDSAKGFGETQLINRCSNGVGCSESEHQMNRRSEFIITKM
ncbi:cell envelope biogenesis protein OmpA [Patiriisocius marinus]|uniref:Cell envelope biogenesis protein OmpA n=1 Tax=Patiriisocius marinus TaxID=1397112 RepID=A0A5J4J2V9_9FLAO|nr:OmpA family protein [Patiriisocius marinus]GER60131.1 cell envelope biogenesis protein OmpA [Patiriisocius marinus]